MESVVKAATIKTGQAGRQELMDWAGGSGSGGEKRLYSESILKEVAEGSMQDHMTDKVEGASVIILFYFYFYFIGLSNRGIGDAIPEMVKAEERAFWGKSRAWFWTCSSLRFQ